jgi:transcriptional regulator with XRE-family HTH domain
VILNHFEMETFGEYIRQLRVNTGLPIRKIAAQLDIDSSLLGRIERNERQANKELIAGIAKIFNQDEADLLQRFLSDQIAYKIIDENADIAVLKVAEQKVEYLKSKIK